MKSYALVLFSLSTLAFGHGAHKHYSGDEVIEQITQHGLAQDLPGTLPNGDFCAITYAPTETGLAVSIRDVAGEETTVVIPHTAQIEIKTTKSDGFTRSGYWFVAEGARKMVSVSKLDDGCDFDLVLWTGKQSPVTCRFRE